MEDDKPRYFIDEKWFTEHNKSFRAIAQTRMCASCRKKIGTEVQERVPTIDPRGRVVGHVSGQISAADLRRGIEKALKT